MRDPVRRCSADLAAVLVGAFAVACSGGGGGDSPPAPGCTRAPEPTSGPGDTANYFPSEVGWTWTYRVQSSGQLETMSVTATQLVGTETAAVFTTGTDVELVVERPWGAYLLAGGPVTPPLDQLYPSLLLPFPVAVTPAAELGRCTALNPGDVDGDRRDDAADEVVTFAVVSVTDTAQVEYGSFTEVAHVQQVAYVTFRTTSSGTLTATLTQDDRFAPGVGRISSSLTLQVGGYLESDAMSLVSFTAPPAPAASAPGWSEPAAAAARRPSVAEKVLGLARAAIAARR